jgi:hypothetical protein
MTSTLVETTDQDVTSVLSIGSALLKLADEPDLPSRIFQATDLFEGTCSVILPEKGSTGLDEHPFGAYNIAYPYCRTAIKVAVDDPDPNPLLAQITSFSRYLSARVVAQVCGVDAPLTTFRVIGDLSSPTIGSNCAVFAIVHPITRQGFLIVDGTKVVLPAQALLQVVTSADQHGVVHERLGWINVLPPGWTEE